MPQSEAGLFPRNPQLVSATTTSPLQILSSPPPLKKAFSSPTKTGPPFVLIFTSRLQSRKRNRDEFYIHGLKTAE